MRAGQQRPASPRARTHERPHAGSGARTALAARSGSGRRRTARAARSGRAAPGERAAIKRARPSARPPRRPRQHGDAPSSAKKFSARVEKLRSKLRFVFLFESGRIPGSPGKSGFRNCGENVEKCRVSHNPCTKAQNLALDRLLHYYWRGHIINRKGKNLVRIEASSTSGNLHGIPRASRRSLRL